MGEPGLVHQTDTSKQLASNVLCLWFRKPSVAPHIASEISVLAVFRDCVKPLGALEPAMELKEELSVLLAQDGSAYIVR